MLGNDHADKAAKRAAAEHPAEPDLVKQMDTTFTIIQHVAAYLGSAWAWWFQNFGNQLDDEEEDDEAPKEPSPDPASPGSLLVVQPPSGYPHQLLWDSTASRYRCAA